MPYATTEGGIELYYELRGSPNATNKIVFVMGMGGTHKNWDLQANYFATLPDYQILLFDNRGAGLSHSPSPPYSITDMASDVLFLVDHVGFHKFHLVGISMGGMMSAHVALAIPEKIVSLTLIVSRVAGGFFNVIPTFTGLYQMYRMRRAQEEDVEDAVMDLLFPSSYLNSIAQNGKLHRENIKIMVEERNKTIPKQSVFGKQGQMAAVKSHGLTPIEMETLKNAKFPILSVGADEDTLVKPHHSYNMPAHIGADLVIVGGAGHAVIQQCGEITNFVLEEFFEKAKLARNPVPEVRRFHCSYIPHSKNFGQSKLETLSPAQLLELNVKASASPTPDSL